MSKYNLHGKLHSPYQEDGVKWMLAMEKQATAQDTGVQRN